VLCRISQARPGAPRLQRPIRPPAGSAHYEDRPCCQAHAQTAEDTKPVSDPLETGVVIPEQDASFHRIDPNALLQQQSSSFRWIPLAASQGQAAAQIPVYHAHPF